MDMHEQQEFQPVTPEEFDKIRAEVKDKTGIEITTDAGRDSAKGITISWKYDRAKQDLTVQTLKRSWYDPSEAVIDQDIHVMIEGIISEKA